ncbi:MAG: Ig-like domain-containing protein, partial [Candidatus Neomarinimicrobiota bacterium]
AGDEVGIFDGDYCVGAGVVMGPIDPYLSLVASTDDPTTTEMVDGFTPGHPISYRLWDASEGVEVIYVTPTYTSGDGTFSSQGTALVALSGATIVPPSHFSLVYTGNPYLAMNIYVTSARIDGLDLAAGDEIGIFDGDYCVGAGVVMGPIDPYLSLVASTDDPTTTEVVDGFTPGHPISYRLWDESEAVEFPYVVPGYSSGEGIFSSQGTAVVALSSYTNNPPILTDVPDTSFSEDQTCQIILAASDLDEDILTFTADSDTPDVVVNVEGTLLTITPTENWNGEARIAVTVTDGLAADSDTFRCTVIAVPDPPGAFALLEPPPNSTVPINAQHPDSALVFIWETAEDYDNDGIEYLLRVTDELLKPVSIDTTIIDPSLALSNSYVFEKIKSAGKIPSSGLITWKWNVRATDGQDTIWANNGPLSFTIDLSRNPVLENNVVPTAFALHSNYPNPFNAGTILRFDLPEATTVNITVYDALGREVCRLVDADAAPGSYKIVWRGRSNNGGELPGGIYFARMRTPYYIKSIKMLLLK